MNHLELLSPIEIALKMEKDGKNFYLTSAEKISNKFIKDMLLSLAKDEEHHITVFNDVYHSIKNSSKFPSESFMISDSKNDYKSVFETFKKENRDKIKTAKDDLDIIKIAEEMENKSYNFYKDLSSKSYEANIKDFFNKLAEIESKHYDILSNTYQYLKSQVDWNTEEEMPIFEG